MLSQLKSYLFGGGPSEAGLIVAPQSPVQDASFIINSIARSEEEDWVLVDSQGKSSY